MLLAEAQEWACTRQFSLGTFLPWDTSWVGEVINSTIYMSYYTVHISSKVKEHNSGDKSKSQKRLLTDPNQGGL
jgi:leucyl-tRNA synthetase